MAPPARRFEASSRTHFEPPNGPKNQVYGKQFLSVHRALASRGRCGWSSVPWKGGALEQVEGADAADEVADDAELAQKEEAGLPRHVDEGRVAVKGVDDDGCRGDETD